MATQIRLIEGLKNALQFADDQVTLRETHISWVLLAGERAWKIKKAVDYGFLDFSSLAKRKSACEEELRLNRRFAPQLYLWVTPIGGSPEHPVLNGKPPHIEYAVCMRRFDESCLFSALAERNELSGEHIKLLAEQIAEIHLQAAIAGPADRWGAPRQVHSWLTQSLEQIKPRLEDPGRLQQIEQIEQRCHILYEHLYTTIEIRNASGFVRECHGDLHLGNIVWYHDRPLAFDCIEFNPALRWIDVISEVAFVMMDLQERGYPALAWRLTNHYLSITGDYDGLRVLRYYVAYRALVRAKVTLFQRDEAQPGKQADLLTQQYRGYADLTGRWLNQERSALLIMHGLSASGKSTVAAELAERYGCLHLRSDVERKRLHGLAALDASGAQLNTGIYTASASDKTYQRLHDIAAIALQSGYPVIVDAAFLERRQREQFRQLAEEGNHPFMIIHCDADNNTLAQRIITRNQQGNDPSEATLAVLKNQLEHQDELDSSEHFVTARGDSPLTLPPAIMHRLTC